MMKKILLAALFVLVCLNANAATDIPLTILNGQVQRYPSGDTITPSNIWGTNCDGSDGSHVTFTTSSGFACGASISLLNAKFTNAAVINYRTLLPTSLTDRNTSFPGSDMSTFTLFTENSSVTPSVSGGSVTITNPNAARSNIYVIGSDLVAPQRFVSVEAVGKNTYGATYDYGCAGVFKDGNNYIEGCYNGTNHTCHIVIKNASVVTDNSVSCATITGTFSIGFSLIGNNATMWYKTTDDWVLGTSNNITSALNFKAATLTSWKAGFEVSANGTSSWVFDNFSYGAFGGVGLRDCAAVHLTDGTAYISAGVLYLTCTVAGPNGYALGNTSGDAYWGVFTLNLSTYALNQIGVIMVSRSATIHQDLGGELINNNDGTFRAITGTWGNGFTGTLQVQYLTSSATLLSAGTYVLSSPTTWTLPSVPSSGGSYSGSLIKVSSTWYLVYDVTTSTAFTTPQTLFYSVLASSPDSAGSPNGTWTLVASDSARAVEEGAHFANINSTIYVTVGNKFSMRLFDSSLNFLGLLKAPQPETVDRTLPQANVFLNGTTYYNLSFDGLEYNTNSFTWGNLYVQTAPTVQ